MTAKFNTRESLSTASDIMTFVVMAGLTVASAATFAFSPMSPARDGADAEPIRLPLVVVTAKKAAEPVRLPLVVVTAKRSSDA